MAKRVYISPSDQVENKYAWGNTNEHVQCQRIAEAETAALRRCGVEVQLAKFGTSMAQRCAESNAFGRTSTIASTPMPSTERSPAPGCSALPCPERGTMPAGRSSAPWRR